MRVGSINYGRVEGTGYFFLHLNAGLAVAGGVEEIFSLPSILHGCRHVLTHRVGVRALILFRKRLSRFLSRLSMEGPREFESFSTLSDLLESEPICCEHILHRGSQPMCLRGTSCRLMPHPFHTVFLLGNDVL